MGVINAIRYKLILRAFACVAQDRIFTKDYQRPGNYQLQAILK
jgi:hypothetical protein